MRQPITWMLIFTVLLCLSSATQAQTSAAAKPVPNPTVTELLDKFVQALGGKEAIEKISSRTSKGVIELEGMGINGTMEMYAKAPNKNAVFIELSGVGKIVNVFDGDNGYNASPMEGLRELSGEELTQARRNADFYQPLHLTKNFPQMEVTGKEKVGSTDTYVVMATPPSGEPQKMYFAMDTGLLMRVDSTNETSQGKIVFETYFSEYKAVEGVKIANTMRQVTSAFTLVLKLTEVKQNVPVEDVKFAKPTGQ